MTTNKELKSVNIWKLKQVKSKAVKYDFDPIGSPKDIITLFDKTDMYEATEEYFYIVCLASNGKPIGIHEVSHGSVNASIVDMREVFKRAILNNATSIICCHNHPSGNLSPSNEDIEVTARLEESGHLLGIKVLDHVITDGQGGYKSLRADGYMKY